MENKMLVAIRVDSSIQIGSGHVMRCLTLAEQLKRLGAEIFFICSNLAGNIVDLIVKKGYAVESFSCLEEMQQDKWKIDLEHTQKILAGLKKKVNWLIVDHYGLDAQWESELRGYTKRIMVIDDLANRQHDCDLLLDQNVYLDMELRYEGLVPSCCKQLLGPRYVVLRSEFYEARKKLRERDGKVRRILIFFGGSDPSNETEKVLGVLRQLNKSDIAIDVVVGMANPNKERVKKLCDDMDKATFYCQVDNMAQLIANADLAIGAGGTATWERCFLGVPSITIVVADNQRQTTQVVAGLGATLYVGESSTVTAQQLSQCIMQMLENSTLLGIMSQKAMKLMDDERNDTIGQLLGDMEEMKWMQ